MSYFSRLTDIVTCNLTELLANEAEPATALRSILHEMEEGLAGARRSVATAAASEERMQRELREYRSQIDHWTSQARQELAAGNENEARAMLLRKQEIEDLIAGLELEHRAAVATREHLTTTLRTIEARLAEARRKQHELEAGSRNPASSQGPAASAAVGTLDADRIRQVEAELQALKQALAQEQP